MVHSRELVPIIRQPYTMILRLSSFSQCVYYDGILSVKSVNIHSDKNDLRLVLSPTLAAYCYSDSSVANNWLSCVCVMTLASN